MSACWVCELQNERGKLDVAANLCSSLNRSGCNKIPQIQKKQAIKVAVVSAKSQGT
jgi:hypothetical protein